MPVLNFSVGAMRSPGSGPAAATSLSTRTWMICAALWSGVAAVHARDAATAYATDDSTSGWLSIDEPLAKAIVAKGGKIDRERVDGTIQDEGLARNDRQFFRARKIGLATSGRAVLFVRPASHPRYAPFYGAHTFRFWIVAAPDEVLLASSADKVAMLASAHQGMHDLLVSQCRGGYCYETTEIFEHGRYRDGPCSTTSIENGETSAGCQ